MEPPPSADPGPDLERRLREIRDAKPKFGCMGVAVTGVAAVVAMGILAFLVIDLLTRGGS